MQLTRNQYTPGYQAKSKAIGTDVRVGGHGILPNAFKAGVHAVFHDGEHYFSLEHKDSTQTGRTDTVVDGVVCHESNGFKHEFKAVDEIIKWDMLFEPDEAPSTIRFMIKASKGLSFYKQTISAEDLANGHGYVVPEAEGSYAVYMDGKRNNKYQTGKVAHIYSPYYVDEDGNKSPLLAMTITPDGDNAKMLLLTDTPEVTAWKNDPIRTGHKLRLDPTLGYSTVGALTFGATTRLSWGYPSDATGGEISAFHTAVSIVAGAPSDGLKLAVLNVDQDAANPDPTGLTVVSQVELIPTVSDDVNVAASGTLLPSTLYGVAFTMESSGTKIKYDSGNPNPKVYFASATFPDAFESTTISMSGLTLAYLMSIWIEYEAAPSETILDYERGVGRGLRRGIMRGV